MRLNTSGLRGFPGGTGILGKWTSVTNRATPSRRLCVSRDTRLRVGRRQRTPGVETFLSRVVKRAVLFVTGRRRWGFLFLRKDELLISRYILLLSVTQMKVYLKSR